MIRSATNPISSANTPPATTAMTSDSTNGTWWTVSEYAAANAPMPTKPWCPRLSWPV